METMVASASIPFPREPANYDEASMHHTLLFSDSLKDLKNLRKQLYSAAEYFEYSYTNDDQKQIVVDTLKDYAIKALVNTVDHLGSVTYKVTDLLDEKVDEVSGTELRVSCIEQRLRSCQEYIDSEGLSQQSLVIDTPKYHKRYVLPGNYILVFSICIKCLLKTFLLFYFFRLSVSGLSFSSIFSDVSCSVGETMQGANVTKSKYQGCSQDNRDDWHEFKNGSVLVMLSLYLFWCDFSFCEHILVVYHKCTKMMDVIMKLFELQLQKRHQLQSEKGALHHLLRVLPSNQERFCSLIPCPKRNKHPEPQKSASMRLPAERDNRKEPDQFPSKSKRLLKALLSRRKSKKDDMLYTYLDEY
ncbi:hypothetical protein RJ640_023263 [Escallonia rubra]|uniref:Protein ABIL2 n=1 Tax=Escallonia rubra TaxID=112253 RepID=A0AA88RZK0_9ASTE|nr:hypothetical protein RJ640_023263 [Escallonia rubra]